MTDQTTDQPAPTFTKGQRVLVYATVVEPKPDSDGEIELLPEGDTCTRFVAAIWIQPEHVHPAPTDEYDEPTLNPANACCRWLLRTDDGWITHEPTCPIAAGRTLPPSTMVLKVCAAEPKADHRPSPGDEPAAGGVWVTYDYDGPASITTVHATELDALRQCVGARSSGVAFMPFGSSLSSALTP